MCHGMHTFPLKVHCQEEQARKVRRRRRTGGAGCERMGERLGDRTISIFSVKVGSVVLCMCKLCLLARRYRNMDRLRQCFVTCLKEKTPRR